MNEGDQPIKNSPFIHSVFNHLICLHKLAKGFGGIAIILIVFFCYDIAKIGRLPSPRNTHL